MGAGASTLPEFLTMDVALAHANKHYKHDHFESLAGPDGLVPKELYVTCILEKGVEKEVYEIFRSYCPSGSMDCASFLNFCRTAKLLNKQFNASMAELRFHKSRGASSTVNYYKFRREIIPEFAQLKNVEVSELLDKLSRCDRYQAEVAPSDSSGADKSPLKLPRLDVGASGEPVALKPITPKEHQAATTIQARSRAKIAQRQAQNMREVKEIKQIVPARRPSKQRQEEDQRVASLIHQQSELKKEIEQLTNGAGSSDSVTPSDAASTPVPNLSIEPAKQLTEAEQADADLNDVFDVYCNPPGEMDAVNFKKFMRETYTLTKKFTINDAEAIFQKTIAKGMSSPPTTEFNKGVFFGKRINFFNFRQVALPLVAHARGAMEIKHLIEFLNNANVAVRNRDEHKRRSSKDLLRSSQSGSLSARKNPASRSPSPSPR